MSYELEQINQKIESVLSGNGSFDDLRTLEAQKRDILDRMHFDSIRELKDEIDRLESEQTTIRETIDRLEADKRELALDVEVAALKTQQIREQHGEVSSRAYLKHIALDDNRKAIITLRNNLETLIKNKIEETI